MSQPAPSTSQHGAFKRLAGSYDSLRGGGDRGAQAAAALRPHVVPGAVAEVGAGTGAVAAGLAAYGHHVVGVDLSRPMLERARERLAGRLLQADAQRLPFGDGSLGNVVFAHALHLVGDMTSALVESARVLRRGGRLLALHGEPFAERDDVVDALAPLTELKPPRPDTVDGLREAAGRAGLRMVSSAPVVEYASDIKPEAFLEVVATRQPPYLWNVDEPTWERVVEPVLDALRSLPEPARPRSQRWYAHCTVLDKE
ncbi:class I SAM-dependent methyltransferase [Streptomyces sp. NPDC048441]|uniref:class I SAM-dependent methyltransferase n=1 Tax=Streptomyces sp. NPDC048441 TaxID=3365552 RepID=UPI00371A350F